MTPIHELPNQGDPDHSSYIEDLRHTIGKLKTFLMFVGGVDVYLDVSDMSGLPYLLVYRGHDGSIDYLWASGHDDPDIGRIVFPKSSAAGVAARKELELALKAHRMLTT
jgi:hypothetical protein